MLLILLAGGGCIPRKKLAYFQAPSERRVDSTFSPTRTDYPLQPGDLLSLRFTGPDPVAIQPFGQENITSANAQVTNIALYVQGYSVSDSGMVDVPVIGRMKVGGLTVEQAERVVQTKLNAFVRGAVVKARLVSFKVSVLGEVRTPGTLYIYNERLTLLEALGYAGDLTDLGNREKVMLIRNRSGKVSLYTLNLTDRRLLGSPYFYLQPNDVIYVEPIANKADRLNLPALSILLSAITSLLVLVSILVR